MKHLPSRMLWLAWFVVSFLVPVVAAASSQGPSQSAGLTVVSVGPTGEVAERANANEVRVVFSEPMVELGRIPSPVTAPFFKISPAVPGTFRWSGTTILVFTPDPKRPLPYATKFDVTIDTTAQAASGRRLSTPYAFSFTTPTMRLVEPHWYRKGGLISQPVLIALRFNQPVRPGDVAAHARAAFQRHPWRGPFVPSEDQARLKAIDPLALDKFNAKVAAVNAVASADGPVGLKVAVDWDKKLFPALPNLVVLETTSPVPPGSWVRLVLDQALPSPGGPATPGRIQEYTVQAEEAFFVDRFRCSRACNPEWANPIELRRPVKVADLQPAVRAIDITTPGAEKPVPKARSPKPRTDEERDRVALPTLEDAGFDAQPPAKTYAVIVDQNLKSADGQTLGYTWLGTVENWHRSAFTSFGDGHGVWEASGGEVLPFYARNFENVRQWAQAIALSQLMPTVLALEQRHFTDTPGGEGVLRKLPVAIDKVQSQGLDMTAVLPASGKGLVWAAVEEGKEVPRASREWADEKKKTPIRRSTLVQVTNLGIAVKDSPQNTLVFVTRLDNGAPVPGARVSIIRPDNSTWWTGTTGNDGVVIAPETPLRDRQRGDFWEQMRKVVFIVTAEKDGDVAYTCSNWNQGVEPWSFGVRFDLGEGDPLLRGSVFTDRGVYRLGEEVHLKAVLRQNAPAGIRPLPPGTDVSIVVHDSLGKTIDERKVKVGRWSSTEWTLKLPEDGNLGDYSVDAYLEQDNVKPKDNREPEGTREGGSYVPWNKKVSASFLVAAYRRPDFRVDLTLSAPEAAPVAGAHLKGVVTSRYLFGAPMGSRPVTWSFSKSPVWSAPAAVYEHFNENQWAFVGWSNEERLFQRQLERKEATLTKTGELALDLETTPEGGIPWRYTLEGDVEDVSRQHIANRADIVVHPASWYIGVRRPRYFVQQKEGVKTEIVSVTPDGKAIPGANVEVTLTQVQWKSVRRAEGDGFYTWETQKTEVPAGTWTVTTAEQPVPLAVPLPSGGYFVLRAAAKDKEGRTSATTLSFYSLGAGYTAWQRFDHQRITLVPERKTYRPGETARILIQSPWEKATALVTTEREGIRSHRQFTLTSTQQSVEIPVTEQDIPNLYVSVLLVKGRTEQPADALKPGADTSDPGKPAFRLGYAELEVENRTKRLTVAVKADKDEYRPANAATVTVDVKDVTGGGAPSEVTLWAVDYGVLSLTGYQTPDVLDSVYVRKALQVVNSDNRERIISRRVLTPKGAAEGGGGGDDAGAGTLRRDFKVLAFWLGSVATDGNGHARVEVKLPESLTTYRIMAVAGDLQSRFGSADAEVRINKPVTLKAAFPRFLAVGDKALFGAVVTSQLKTPTSATVSFKSLDPALLELAAPAQQTITLQPGASAEVRFDVAAKAIGRARVQISVRAGNETDAFEDVLPTEVLASPETVAAYGEVVDARSPAIEKLTIPAGVVSGFGGLHVELASTAMVGLSEGAAFLVEYPYGCAEQRASRSLAMLLASDIGDVFKLPGIDAGKLRPTVQASLKELEKYQCPSGAFAYWSGDCLTSSAYLTAYVLHVLKIATDLKYTVSPDVMARAYNFLQAQLSQPPPANEGWWPSYTAWQAFAVKVLVEGGRNQDSNLTRLYGYRDRMPLFALAYLADAMAAGGETTSARIDDLRRRLANAILVEGGSAHVEELSDPYLVWYWSSHVRSTAIALNTLVKAGGAEAPIRGLVRWLMTVRKDGRWGNTQENAMALEALVAYYRKYEAATPDFRATVAWGHEELARAEFKERSTTASASDQPMAQLLTKAPPGTSRPLVFSREGTGTLFYTARLRYAADQLFQQGLDSGIAIERSYAPYVESGAAPAATTSYKAGDLVRVTLTLRLTKERRFVAVSDPLPAGFEPVESWFRTTAAALSREQDEQPEATADWYSWWQRGGFDHVERHDDRVLLFATRLSEGRHTFTYIARATTAGTFRTAPAHAEEMYEPEVFGRTATAVVDVKK